MSTFSDHLVPFFTLSYPVDTPSRIDSFPDSQYYTNGPLDACLIVTCIAVMALLRDFVRLAILEPFARWHLTRDLRRKHQLRSPTIPNGTIDNDTHHHHHHHHPPSNGEARPISKREARLLHRSVLRFAEQGWPAIYYIVQWTFGFYIHRNLPTKMFHPIHLWLNYPHTLLAAPVKFYYLTQTAFYLHQVLILNAEARRKDHIQMMAHHVITILLMTLSYICSFTRVGCLIMVLMDYCDIFLPIAKMLRYLAYRKLCDATFVWFLLSWFVTRHVLYNFVLWSVYAHLPHRPTFLSGPDSGIFLSKGTWLGFFLMLVALQVLQIIWFGMICRVAWRVISGQGADDERSDDESAGEDTEEEKKYH